MISPQVPSHKRINLAKVSLPEVPLLGMANIATAGVPLKKHVHRGLMEIHYLKMGEQVFNVEGRDYTLKSGDIFVTWPKDRHSTGKRPHGRNVWFWTQFYLPRRPAPFLGMSGEVVWPVIQQLWKLPCRHFHANKRIETLYREIFTLAESPVNEATTANIASRYLLWLMTVIDCSKQFSRNMGTDDINSIIKMIENRPCEYYSIDGLAELTGLSVSRFKAKFREQTGLPPHEFILRIKIKRAYELLRRTNQSVTAIAHSLNFSSSQYFATVFRRFYNTSPSDVRK